LLYRVPTPPREETDCHTRVAGCIPQCGPFRVLASFTDE
jgi:hypothetical protein